MTCYRPLYRIENSHKYNTAMDGHKYKSGTILKPDDNYEMIEKIKNSPFYTYTKIPCKQCIGCRLDYSKDWANRGYLESKSWNENYFVTLTYDDENLKTLEEIVTKDGITFTRTDEWLNSLIDKDFTKFLHHLRQLMERKYNHKGIRFMGCGEYGDKGKRPHYHLILFNLPLPADSFYNSRIINNEFYWQNNIIEQCWKKGISNITVATWNTIAYTARYITKKITGKNSEDLYAQFGLKKEFLRCSKNPGIGWYYYEENKHKIYKYDKVIIKNKSGITEQKPPKYYDQLYEKEYPEEFKKIKSRRRKYAEKNDLIRDDLSSYTRQEQLTIQENTHEEKHKMLRRQFESQT